MWHLSCSLLQDCLSKVLFFGQLEEGLRSRIAADMYERRVSAGEILIQEGDTGLTAAELYIVKEGEFEVRLCPYLSHSHNHRALLVTGHARLHLVCHSQQRVSKLLSLCLLGLRADQEFHD
jgi:hypothetical protein